MMMIYMKDKKDNVVVVVKNRIEVAGNHLEITAIKQRAIHKTHHNMIKSGLMKMRSTVGTPILIDKQCVFKIQYN